MIFHHYRNHYELGSIRQLRPVPMKWKLSPDLSIIGLLCLDCHPPARPSARLIQSGMPLSERSPFPF